MVNPAAAKRWEPLTIIPGAALSWGLIALMVWACFMLGRTVAGEVAR